MEYTGIFESELYAPLYQESSLFFKLENLFLDALNDIHSHLTTDSPLKLHISQVILRNVMNLKDFIEISLL